jgi:hypothetical protein
MLRDLKILESFNFLTIRIERVLESSSEIQRYFETVEDLLQWEMPLKYSLEHVRTCPILRWILLVHSALVLGQIAMFQRSLLYESSINLSNSLRALEWLSEDFVDAEWSNYREILKLSSHLSISRYWTYIFADFMIFRAFPANSRIFRDIRPGLARSARCERQA